MQNRYIYTKKNSLLPFLYVISVLLAIILPLSIWQVELPFVESTFKESKPFEIFSFLISTILMVVTWIKVKRRRERTLITLTPTVLPLLTSLELLSILLQGVHHRSSDYLCYETAAQAIIDGFNPYAGKTVFFSEVGRAFHLPYIYPPLAGQVLAFLKQLVSQVLFSQIGENDAWQIVFYLYQCSQFLLVILAYFLTYRLAKQVGMETFSASLIVSALFIFNTPLIRTLEFNQINLWVLVPFLLATLLIQRFPFISGLAIALGGHIKLYPFILFLPWILTRRWIAILGAVVGSFTIILIQTNWGRDWSLWYQFFAYLHDIEKPTNYRNSGLYSLVFNLFKPLNKLLNTHFSFVDITVNLLILVAFTWFIVRIVRRERLYFKLSQKDDSGHKDSWSDIFRLYGHSVDAIALSLLISPSVWEHHYVLAIPVALWAIATRGTKQVQWVGVGTFLIFCLPTFEIFPLSYHRLIGLLILVWLTAPESIPSRSISPNMIWVDT